MTIPALPVFFDMQYTQTDGRLSPDGHLYNDQMFQSLNVAVQLINSAIRSMLHSELPTFAQFSGFKNVGIKFPPFSTSEIALLQPTADNGTVWFNTTLKKLQVKTDTGVIETIQSV